MAIMKRLAFALLAAVAAAQNVTESIPPSATLNGTMIPNPTLFATPFVLNVEDMWDLLIGPVSTAFYTTTVSATSVPSSSLVPPPPIHYPAFPTGAQVAMTMKNESWSFPKDFWYGNGRNLELKILTFVQVGSCRGLISGRRGCEGRRSRA